MKKLILSFVIVFGILSCTDNSLELRDSITKDLFYGKWKDVTVSVIPGIDATFKSAIFTFHQDGTYEVDSINSPLDVISNGKWDYDENNNLITFHENSSPVDSIVNSEDWEKYNVIKSWDILQVSDTELDVNYNIFRKEDYIYDKINTNEIIDTVQGINITISRSFVKL